MPFGKINIIFLQTSAEAGVYVRETLGMHEQSEGKPYFSPIGSGKYLIINNNTFVM